MDQVDVLYELGHGGSASVYLCREKLSNRLVAIKRIPLHRLVTAEQKRHAAAECDLLEHAVHPFLCCGLGHFDDDDFHSLKMEYIEDARPLYQCIWRYKDTSVFPERIAKYFAAQIVLAVEEIHALGYIHRDLKSGNVLVDKRGIARVIDYGFAKKLHDGSDAAVDEERTFSVCGTHYIMAPEVYLRQSYGVGVDWWALGVIVHEMVCGRPPWDYKPAQGKSPINFFDTVSEIAKGCSMGQHASPMLVSADVSEECRSFIRELLVFSPRTRLGHSGGAEQVKAHPWFSDIDWDSVTHTDSRSPYDLIADYRTDTQLANTLAEASVSSSSAESIDPDDNAKFFGDF